MRRQAYIVACHNAEHAEYQEYPFDFRLFFSDLLSFEKLYGLEAIDTDTVEKEREQVERRKNQYGNQHRNKIEIIETGDNLSLQKSANQKRTQLVEQDTENDSQNDRNQGRIQRFTKQYACDMTFLHTEHVIQSVFAFTLLHQKTVDVQYQNKG